MKRSVSLFGVGLTLAFVMFSTGSLSRTADAAFPVIPPTEAPTAAQKAKQHYLQGESYFKSRNFSGAMDEYQQGYLEKPDPVFIFNMAQCQRLLGHREAAVEYYQRYLREAPEGPGRGVAEKQIADLQGPSPADELVAPAYAAAPPVPAEVAAAPVIPLPATVVAPTVPVPEPVVEGPPGVPDSAPRPVPAANIDSVPAPAPPVAVEPVYVTVRAEPTAPPVYKRWWFWTAAAAVVVGTILVASATSPGRPDCDAGRICK